MERLWFGCGRGRKLDITIPVGLILRWPYFLQQGISLQPFNMPSCDCFPIPAAYPRKWPEGQRVRSLVRGWTMNVRVGDSNHHQTDPGHINYLTNSLSKKKKMIEHYLWIQDYETLGHKVSKAGGMLALLELAFEQERRHFNEKQHHQVNTNPKAGTALCACCCPSGPHLPPLSLEKRTTVIFLSPCLGHSFPDPHVIDPFLLLRLPLLHLLITSAPMWPAPWGNNQYFAYQIRVWTMFYI